MQSVKALLPVGLAVLGLCACFPHDALPYDPGVGGSAGGGPGGGGSGGGGSGGGGGEGGNGGSGSVGAICTEPTPVACEDQVVLGMNLKAVPAPGLIQSSADGPGFRSKIDATAGGAFNADPDSYVYGRFTDSGLEKVAISDEDSLSSMDWDIAFRRYVVRINSGPSGPSCVKAAHLKDTVTYDSVTAVPEDLRYHADDYFTAACTIIPDGSGLPNAPATALSGYWSYSDCLAMTDAVYVLQLANGRRLTHDIERFTDAIRRQERPRHSSLFIKCVNIGLAS